jgi:Gpi18-like mannosyltransferase
MLQALGSLRSFSRQSIQAVARLGLGNVAALVIGLGLAIAIRVPLLPFRSADFYNSLRPWYSAIQHSGFRIFATDFSTYNPPYLYELYLIARFMPDVGNVVAIKIPSLVADFICALFVFRIVDLKYPGRSLPILAAFAFLFAPTVVLNSAFWGQADVLFTAPLLACIYFLMLRRPHLALLAFGISLAFKLQAIFLLPLLVALLLRGQVKWYHFLWVPVVLFAAVVPAWAAGRPIHELILVYAGQVQQFQLLSMEAPTVYTWMPDVGLTQRFFTGAGVVFTAFLAMAFAYVVWRSRAALAVPLLLKLALLSVLIIPFFLPKMHDRYFYPADAISILYAFFFPQYFFVPLVITLASFFAYQPVLFEIETVPMSWLAAGIFAVLALVARDAFAELISAKEGDDAGART